MEVKKIILMRSWEMIRVAIHGECDKIEQRKEGNHVNS
jgi:hypothetical protein